MQREILKLLRKVALLGAEAVTITPATKGGFESFEAEYGIRLPRELREWLLLCNGAAVNPGGIYGIRTGCEGMSMEDYLDGFPAWKRKGWLPLAGDGCGDYYVLVCGRGRRSTGGSPVVFVDQCDYSVADYAVASDVWHFLWFLLDNELRTHKGFKGHWPFERRFVLAKDPKILGCRAAPLPWNLQ